MDSGALGHACGRDLRRHGLHHDVSRSKKRFGAGFHTGMHGFGEELAVSRPSCFLKLLVALRAD